jgi:hypothetical protein
MSISQEGAPEGAERRASIERMLAEYPDISAEQIGGLVAWFVREASALDVGLIASNEAIRPGYVRFRSDHLDRFRIKDAVVRGALRRGGDRRCRAYRRLGRVAPGRAAGTRCRAALPGRLRAAALPRGCGSQAL